MENYLFSYGNYNKMCDCIQKTGLLCDYRDVLTQGLDQFIVLRHDVEFSPERAYNLAKFENQINIVSSYFFQITNNAYNTLSGYNVGLLKEIHAMGHHIGLHFHLNGMTDIAQISVRIKYEAELLSYYLGLEVDRFSFHRPTAHVLERNLKIEGLINAYAPEFFTYYDADSEIPPQVNTKYIADSKNNWQYTAPYPYPSEKFFEEYKRIQILCHPYSWTETGYETLSNLRSLISEKRVEFIQTLNSETKYVMEYINEL